MAKRTGQAKKTAPPRWVRNTTREAIVAAARHLVARDGVAQFSLGRVADEAGFAPPTVYAYFLNKNDLLQSIVADDVATLAHGMVDVFPANEDDGDVEEESPPESDEQPDAEPGAQPDAQESAPEVEFRAEDLIAEASAVEELAPAPTEPERQPPPAAEADIQSQFAALADWVDESNAPAAREENSQAPAEAENSPQAPEPEAETPVPEAHVTFTPEQLIPDDALQCQIPVAEAPAQPETVSTPVVHMEDALPEQQETPAEPEAPEQPREEPPPESAPVAPTVDPSRVDELAQTVARLEAMVAKLEARPVDAWLERRLREFERALVSLDDRQSKTEQSGGGAPAEAALRSLEERLDAGQDIQRAAIDDSAKDLAIRLDSSKKELRQSILDVRTLVLEVSGRVDAVERAAQIKASYGGGDMPHTDHIASGLGSVQVLPRLEPQAAEATPEPAPEAAPQATGEDSYLSQARRSAKAAAEQTEQDAGQRASRLNQVLASLKAASSGTRLLIAGSIALLVVLAGAGLALKSHATAETKVAPPVHTAAATGRRAVLAPQIRLARLANGGNAQAQLLLGLEYLDGTGATKNESQAATWISRAAARGEAVAQMLLGALYGNGRGVAADPSQALHWYEEAAMQGNRKAMHELAVSYAEGWGAPKNYGEAARWFSRAASLGYVDSEFNLAVLYERGLGVPQSLLDAYKWYAIAAAAGDKGSVARIATLKTQMSAEDLAAAQTAATQFSPEPVDQAANLVPKMAELPRG